MATQTTHYSLVKPAYEDQADVGVLNGDLDQIDELIYDANNDVRPVSKGGTGGATAAEARTNLGLGDVLDDVGALETNLGGAKFIRKAIAGHGNITYTFTGDCRYIILCTGYQAGYCCIIFGTCTSSGGIYVAGKIDVASSGSITAAQDGTYKLKVTNAGSSQTNTLMIVIAGTEPTVA